MPTLAAFEPNGYTMIIVGMFAVLILIGGICTYAWHDAKRKSVFKLQKEREQTHREIAAYVAEGSISPADAERMIRAMGPLGTPEQAAVAKFEVTQERMRA